MNTVIIISWWARTATVFFTDIKGVYKLDLGKVTTFKGARHLICREMLYKHGIALSRMKLGRATDVVYFLRAKRVEMED